MFQLGATDVFDASKSNLSGMSEKTGLYVSGIIQKVYINVTEIGVEAAAATEGNITF